VLRYAGFAAAVPDGCEELQHAAHYVTKARGGEGALREVIEFLLKTQGRWDDLLRKFGA
jgi:3-deoxy-D-manno-octulosonate 8-phosphate phosphatase (KDO 8-P phosphatase)